MKVLMVPHLDIIRDRRESGIQRVVAEYFRYLPQFDIELVSPDATDYDIKVAHAGSNDNKGDHPHVAMTHGLMWTSDHDAPRWEYKANQNVIDAVRHARITTVPSPWVAEAFQRDMKFTPVVIPHGIRAEEWRHSLDPGGYILWNKNRRTITCDPAAVTELAIAHPDQVFVTTFANDGAPDNVNEIGVVPHADMKVLIQRSAVYLSTVKETFGIGVLEAMAAGVPVLGWAQGGNIDLVQHGVSGYLARTGDYDDLINGLAYCLEHRRVLGANGQEAAERWTWESAVEKVASVYKSAMEDEPPTVAIVIPSYNYGDKVGRAIESAISQSYSQLTEIVVVDDGSQDDGETERAVAEFVKKDSRVRYVRQENSGVAIARNSGIRSTEAKYICCLDADDAIEADFIRRLVPALEADRSVGITYSGLRVITKDGKTGLGRWPGEFSYEGQIGGNNQVPTCCLFRREMWSRLGGYRQRYAPTGAGAEDAEFWLRAGSIGYNAIKVTSEPLFVYTWGSGHTSHPAYKETNWLEWSPWVYDGHHPFASVAKPETFSHPVRAYDEPLVSVIIPVGPGHQTLLIDAIDSVESQTFRKWELIIVDDTGDATDCDNCEEGWLDELMVTYPYLRVHKTPGKTGAGYARNRGVELSRAPYLLYLDADDLLKPSAIEEMLIAHSKYGGAIYTDYEAHATGVSNAAALKSKVKYHDPSDGYTVLSKRAMEYDWRRIQRGIENPPYIWNLITTLIPKTWHYEIGGFDEAMPSWEDYDYWVRMAYAGKSFTRLPMELVVYLYHTGSRREEGHEIGGQLIHYLKQKREGVEMAKCSGCGKKAAVTSFRTPVNRSAYVGRAAPATHATAQDDQFVLVKYITPNKSQAHVYGTAQFQYRMQISPGMFLEMRVHPMGGFRFYYGYHGGDETFMVHKADADLEAKFEPIEPVRRERQVEIDIPAEERDAPPPPPMPTRMTVEDILGGEELVNGVPTPTASDNIDDEQVALRAILDNLAPESYDTLSTMLVDEVTGQDRKWAIDMIKVKMDEQLDPELDSDSPLDKSDVISYSTNSDDLQRLPGIGKVLADELRENGYTTIEEIVGLGIEEIKNYKGVGEVKAQRIIGAAVALMKG